MNRTHCRLALWTAALLATASVARGQNNPHIGYVYPAGGERGTEFEVTVGGQYLSGASGPLVSGEGVVATVVDYWRPLTQKQINDLRQKLEEVQKRVQEERRSGGFRPGQVFRPEFRRIAEEMGVSQEDLDELADARRRRNDPKRQPNPQIEEKVTLKVTIADDAPLGRRELRLPTAAGLSNPLAFEVSRYAECRESEPNDKTPDRAIEGPLPVVVNGQILPGDVDRFSFEAKKGQRLLVAVEAQELIPYLADAVPGWFQAAISLEDASGREVAFADDFRFHPDPVLYYQIPEDGEYCLKINDAVYRGREDFVYRITLGEVPFVTGVFPLGGREGERTPVTLSGWDLPVDKTTLDAALAPGVRRVSVLGDDQAFGTVPFAVDDLPEQLEQEPNDQPAAAQKIDLPVIVNGRIDGAGNWDVFAFEGRAGEPIVVEVLARRLGSPLDSLLELTDADGRSLAVSDDCDDKGDGLTTHHADSRLECQLPADGTYYVRLGDTQQKGGQAYAYRLRIAPPRPDFALRVVPASVNARAGTTVPVTVYALRRDGFSGDVELGLADAPPGFALSGGWVPEGQDEVRLTLSVPPSADTGLVRLELEGTAWIDGRKIRRRAVPAEDMMQAFIYRHLVPAEAWIASVNGRGRARFPVALAERYPVLLPAGGTATARFFVPPGPFIDQIQLELSDPPEGITIDKVLRDRDGAALVLAADADKIQAGLKGNLIVEAFVELGGRFNGGKPPANKRRVPAGFLPAIPFQVIGSSEAASPGSTER